MRSFLRSLTRISTLLLVATGGIILVLLFFFPSLFSTLIEELKNLTITLGWKNYLLAALICIIESIPFLNVFFPGAILVIIIGGFVAQTNFRGIAAVVIFFNIIGDGIAYFLGTYKGNPLLETYGNTIGLTSARLEKIKNIMKKYDYLAILASKWTNYTRGIIPFFAGLSHNKRKKFFLRNTVGSSLYGIIIIRLAKIFVGNYVLVLPYIRIIAAVIIIGALIWYLISNYDSKRKARQIHS